MCITAIFQNGGGQRCRGSPTLRVRGDGTGVVTRSLAVAILPVGGCLSENLDSGVRKRVVVSIARGHPRAGGGDQAGDFTAVRDNDVTGVAVNGTRAMVPLCVRGDRPLIMAVCSKTNGEVAQRDVGPVFTVGSAQHELVG